MDRRNIIELDRRHVWHPYTQMEAYLAGPEPLVIREAEGSRLIDSDGRSYIDGNSSWWTALLGHRHPRLVEALTRQAGQLAHTALAGITHEPAAALARDLSRVTPGGLDRIFFSDDGSTAVEVAIKLCLQYWHQNGRPARRRFVALGGAFHGDTLGVTALGGVEVFRKPFAGVLLECLHVPPEHEHPEAAFDALERVLDDGADTIAGVVIEPVVQGAAGMRVYDPAYVRAVRELTERHDTFMVADEVFTGYGRTGPMWAVEHAGVVPDVLCTAKGFCGGMLPMAATAISERIFEGFLGDATRAFYYGHTFCGNPLGAAVAREVLAVYRDEHILERAAPKAGRIREVFAELGQLEGVARARSLGMVGALDLVGDGGGYLDRAGWQVWDEAVQRGAYLRPLGNVVYVTPPLNIPDDDLDELLGIVAESVQTVARART